MTRRFDRSDGARKVFRSVAASNRLWHLLVRQMRANDRSVAVRSCVLGVAFALALLALGDSLAPATASALPARFDRSLGEVPDTILERWRDDQLADGNFQRPSGSPVWGGYGNGALAYAMLLEAVRSGDRSYFRAAMKAY